MVRGKFSLIGCRAAAHMACIVTDRVRRRAQMAFTPAEAARAIEAFEASDLPLLGDRPDQRERVHLAILWIAGGDPGRFDATLKDAMLDWRNTLVESGLAHENWPAVLRERENT